MKRASNKTIDQLANRVLEHYDLTPPIDVETIVQSLGGKLQQESLDYDGSIKVKKDGFLIVLNEQNSPERRRFTLAHELGHLFLHTSYLNKSSNQEYEDSILYRGLNHSHEEREANRFAGALLMPEEHFVKAVETYTVNGACEITKLACHFAVSVRAAKLRGCYLGLFNWHER